MGIGSWDSQDWNDHIQASASQTQQQIFSSTNIQDDLNPLNFKIRESCDSPNHPNSTPIIISVDVTGSMGHLAEEIVRKGLGVLIQEINSRKPVQDPHVMIMATGDVQCDKSPIQATQFEADNCLVEQLKKIYLESGGGGNGGESYNAAWYFAATRTKCDSLLNRNKKGYLFTVGDEPPHMVLGKDRIKEFFGDDLEHDLSSMDLVTMASKGWEIFHIIVNPGAYPEARRRFTDLLGERCIELTDHNNLCELIVSTIQVNEGADLNQVANTWSGNTALVVRQSLDKLTPGTVSPGTVSPGTVSPGTVGAGSSGLTRF